MSAAREIARLAKIHAHVQSKPLYPTPHPRRCVTSAIKDYVFIPVAIFIAAERRIIQRDATILDLYAHGVEATSV